MKSKNETWGNVLQMQRLKKKFNPNLVFLADGGPKHENGVIPNERTELMDRRDRDSSILKSDDARSHASGVSSHQSHNSSHPSSGGTHGNHIGRRRGSYDKLNFPRHDLQTLGMLGK